jgi:hypothetical protein
MARARSKHPVKPTVLIDTREKPANRLFAASESGDKSVAAYIEQKVDAGDYTVAEIPNLVVIEKKQDGKELYTNFILKKERFMREVERMRAFKHKYILIQQTYDEFIDPKNWKYVRRTTRARFAAIAAVETWLISLAQTENIQFIFAGKKNAPRIARKILVKTYEWERKRLMREGNDDS